MVRLPRQDKPSRLATQRKRPTKKRGFSAANPTGTDSDIFVRNKRQRRSHFSLLQLRMRVNRKAMAEDTRTRLADLLVTFATAWPGLFFEGSPCDEDWR